MLHLTSSSEPNAWARGIWNSFSTAHRWPTCTIWISFFIMCKNKLNNIFGRLTPKLHRYDSVYLNTPAHNSDFSNTVWRDFAPNANTMVQDTSTGNPAIWLPFMPLSYHYFSSPFPSWHTAFKICFQRNISHKIIKHGYFCIGLKEWRGVSFSMLCFLLSLNYDSTLSPLKHPAAPVLHWNALTKPILQWRKSWGFFCCCDIPIAIKTLGFDILDLYFNRAVHHFIF